MPTISDLKDQARTLEQQGQLDKALTIYQHILKHLEGTPALAKVLPLYVKAGDLLHKMNREDEAVASYQTAAEQYAASGAAPRVTALCGKIIRLVPERRDVYTVFVRQLIDHGHVGSARDVLADYTRYAGMDKAIETLDDLAGRPNSEVQPILERLLSSLELDDESEQTAARLSSQLEEVTDSLAGELSGVPETSDEDDEEDAEGSPSFHVDEDVDEDEEQNETAAEEAHEEDALSETEPLTPPMFDLDHMARQSSMHRAIRIDDEEEDEVDEVENKTDDGPADFGADIPDGEKSSGIEITRNVSPTMDGMQSVSGEVEESFEQDESDGFEVEHTPVDVVESSDDDLESLLADATAADYASEPTDVAPTSAAVEFEGSEWKPDFPESKAEDTVAAEWSPEEELKPAARYPSDEYDTPEADEESDTAESALAEPDALDDEISRAVEDSHAFAALASEPKLPADKEEAVSHDEEPASHEIAAEPEPEPIPRPSRPPLITVPQDSGAPEKSPILFGIVGLVVGALVGAGLTFLLLGGGSGSPPAADPVEQPTAVVDTPATRAETPRVAEPEPVVASPVTSDPVAVDTPAIDTGAETPVDSTAAAEAEPATLEEASPDITPAAPTSAGSNPIIVEGMPIDEISEIEYDGRPGYRVVHLLEWGDPIVIEAVRDTSVTMSTFIQVNVTPPDTVVGIRRLDGYMVYASGVMPEDSLRSLMSRLVVGEPQN